MPKYSATVSDLKQRQILTKIIDNSASPESVMLIIWIKF